MGSLVRNFLGRYVLRRTALAQRFAAPAVVGLIGGGRGLHQDRAGSAVVAHDERNILLPSREGRQFDEVQAAAIPSRVDRERGRPIAFEQHRLLILDDAGPLSYAPDVQETCLEASPLAAVPPEAKHLCTICRLVAGHVDGYRIPSVHTGGRCKALDLARGSRPGDDPRVGALGCVFCLNGVLGLR